MVEMYQTQPHSALLYIGSILVDEFCSEPGCLDFLMAMLDAFLPKTLELLQGDVNGCRNHPDTVDDFFRLNARYIQRAALPYLKSANLRSILECALTASRLEHREANQSVMKFLFDIVHCERGRDEAADFEERCVLVGNVRKEWFGQCLVEALLRAAIFDLPSYTLHDIGDVLFELMLLDRAHVCKWLEEALTRLEGKATRKQLVHFHNEATKAEEAKDVADALRQFSRLWR